jgi:hypothetical protein
VFGLDELSLDGLSLIATCGFGSGLAWFSLHAISLDVVGWHCAGPHSFGLHDFTLGALGQVSPVLGALGRRALGSSEAGHNGLGMNWFGLDCASVNGLDPNRLRPIGSRLNGLATIVASAGDLGPGHRPLNGYRLSRGRLSRR